MFMECHSLASVDVSNFDTSRSESFSFMFTECRSLTTLDLSNFVLGEGASCFNRCLGCNSLTTIKEPKMAYGGALGYTTTENCNSLTKKGHWLLGEDDFEDEDSWGPGAQDEYEVGGWN